MGIDISDARSRQFSIGNKSKYLIGVCYDRPGKRAQIFDHLDDPRYIPECQLSKHKRMHDDIATIEKSSQPQIVAPKMVYPNRRVGENHRRGRRRGGALASGCEPPRRASRRAASRSTNAFNASLTTADFSVTPAYSCAFANNSSSTAIVVLIRPTPIASNIAPSDADFYALICAEARITRVTPHARHSSLRASYETAGFRPPSVTSTISGGTPRRNGMMLQPRPPETTTSQFSRVCP